MPPKKKVVVKAAAVPKKASATNRVPNATEAALQDEVVDVLGVFYRHIIRDTHQDEGGVNIKRDRPSVFAWTHFNEESWAEKFLIRKKDGTKFTPKFLAALQSKLKALVNRIIEANNAFLVATNYHLCPLSKKDIDSLLAVSISNSGLLQVELEYKTELQFDYTKIEDAIESYQEDGFLEKKGDQLPLDLLVI